MLPSTRHSLHHTIYVYLLYAMAVSMNVSTFVSNLLWFLLLVNWVAEWDWRAKVQRWRESPLLHAFVVLFGVTVVWLLAGGNWGAGLTMVQKSLPLLVIPAVILTSAPLSDRERQRLKACYAATVVALAVVAAVRWAVIDYVPYRELMPFNSNIRFALSICLVLFMLAAWLIDGRRRPWWHTAVALAVAALLLWVLVLLRSFTALVVIAVVGSVAACVAAVRSGRWWRRAMIGAAYIAIVGSAATYAYSLVRDYYEPTPLELSPLATHTAGGHAYSHANDGMIENGGQLNNYVCDSELRAAWPLVSQTPIDSPTPNGYSVHATLLRYLGSRGLTKDSAGIMALTPSDIASIENGVANHVYVDGSTPRKMVYTMLYEYEKYKATGSVENSSMGTRMAWWDNAWHIICEHPFFGVGTGNLHDACRARFEQQGSPLAAEERNLHNQYLTYLLMFGIVGFVLIGAAFVRALWKGWRSLTMLQWAFVLMVLISCLDDDTLLVFSGIVLATVPIAMLRHGAEEGSRTKKGESWDNTKK